MASTSEHEVETIDYNLILNHMIFTKSDNDVVYDILNNGDFWDVYTVKKSIPDGHCLLYSVVESLNSQIDHLESVTIDGLIRIVRDETAAHMEYYSQFMIDTSNDNLFEYMNLYIYDKLYNTPYGDLVPLVLANALNINIVIISEGIQCLVAQTIHANSGDEVAGEILIYKSSEHYDGIILKQKFPHSNSAYMCNVKTTGGTSLCRREVHDGELPVHYDNNRSGITMPPHISGNHLATPETGVSVGSSARASEPIGHTRSRKHDPYNIKVCCWNMNGLTQEKLSKDLIGGYLSDFDIVLLCETWTAADDIYELQGYTFYNYPRPFKHHNARRCSGGLGIFIRDNITKGIKIIKFTKDMIAWIRLEKQFFDLEYDIYIAIVYFMPEGSTNLTDDPFTILLEDITELPDPCQILACGDYNARTNVLADYDADDMYGSSGGLDDVLPGPHIDPTANVNESMIKMLHCKGKLTRYSRDTADVNNYGKKLLELCKSSGLLIMNGRFGTDKGVGNFTRIETTGNSVVDYGIITPALVDFISEFSIGKKFPESDHLPLSMSIKCRLPSETTCRETLNNNWVPYDKYKWSHDLMHIFQSALSDSQSRVYYQDILNQMISMNSCNDLAESLNYYVTQAADRTFEKIRPKNSKHNNRPAWYDLECRLLRSEAIKAGERASTNHELRELSSKSRAYKACKQRKIRHLRRNIISRIENAFQEAHCKLWDVLKSVSSSAHAQNMPCPGDFFVLFRNLSLPRDACYFDYKYEKCAIAFLNDYDNGKLSMKLTNEVKLELLNDNFTVTEINKTIELLKNNKSPGLDSIPSEFIKLCKHELVDIITVVLNYIIECRDFPDLWAEGLRTPIFKNGRVENTDNYRGITVLSVFAKIFETAVNNRIVFAREAFKEDDEFNGGFLKGSRTTDNIFIVLGLIQRQLFLGKPIFICMVDFSKAFDLINRHILFYKLMKQGYHGKVIDTLRSLYRKTYFKVKCNGMLSAPIHDQLGVNQGGNASPTLFRTYLADLGEYLTKHVGLCISNIIIAHLLWADDLVLISDSELGLQKQLNGLHKFCSTNLMIVNELKTKVLVFGTQQKANVRFNGEFIEQVESYKYLGNILTTVHSCRGDIFSKNYEYLSGQSRKAMYSIKKRLKSAGQLPPRIQIHLFENLVRPILLYGSDVWGVNVSSNMPIDKLFYHYMRCVLHVKSTTSNVIVAGECGQMPPSVYCHINTLCYLKRLKDLPDTKVVKQVYNELYRLHQCGVKTWVTKACELAEQYEVDISSNDPNFKKYCKMTVSNCYKRNWLMEVTNTNRNPILRTYSLFKNEFGLEKYLGAFSDCRYRIAMSKLRSSSHTLEIERGRYTKPKTDVCRRLCSVCNVIEDELHFLIHCKLYEEERLRFLGKVSAKIQNFHELSDVDKFISLMANKDNQIVSWTGKFIHTSFNIRSTFFLNRGGI